LLHDLDLSPHQDEKLFSNAHSRDEHFMPSFIKIPPLSTEISYCVVQNKC